MTFQQLEYIVAVDRTRHFVNAATACGVTQSTLSATIAKLEQEIDVIIFDRTKRPLEPTPMGQKIIQQAEVILRNSAQLREMVQNEREELQGELAIGMVPSVAPVLFPHFGRKVSECAPSLKLRVHEHRSSRLIEALQQSELDFIILDNSDLTDSNLLTIDLWTERFVVYASNTHPFHSRESIRLEDMFDGNIWTLRSFHDHYRQISDVTHQNTIRQTVLESGSLHTLIAAVDANGGFTLLPEIFANCLSEEQKRGLHNVNSGKFFRTMSLAIRQDCMRERMLNMIISTIKQIIPKELLVPTIAKNDYIKI